MSSLYCVFIHELVDALANFLSKTDETIKTIDALCLCNTSLHKRRQANM